MLAVLDKFLAGFYVANKVNFQNCLANFLNRLKNSQHVFGSRQKLSQIINEPVLHDRVLNIT